MLYDPASKDLETPALARMVVARNAALGAISTLTGGIACAIGLTHRAPELTRAPPLFLAAVPLALTCALAIFFAVIGRRPPASVLERFATEIDAQRRAGKRVRAVSRAFLAMAGVLTFAVALAVVLWVPLR